MMKALLWIGALLGVGLIAILVWLLRPGENTQTQWQASEWSKVAPSLTLVPDSRALASEAPQVAQLDVTSPTSAPINVQANPSLVLESISQASWVDELATHLTLGLPQARLQQLYHIAKSQQWPVDWLFLSGSGIRSLSSVAPFEAVFVVNHFYIETNTDESNSPNQQAFFDWLAQCKGCNPMVGQWLLFQTQTEADQFEKMLTDTSLWTQYPVMPLALWGVQFLFLDAAMLEKGSISELAISDVLREKMPGWIDWLSQSANADFAYQGRMAQALWRQEFSQYVKLLAEFEQLDIRSIVKTMRGRFDVSEVTLFESLTKLILDNPKLAAAQMDWLADLVHFHGQYYSIDRALEFVSKLDESQLTDHVAVVSLKKAKAEGFDRVSDRWMQQHAQIEDYFASLKGQNGHSVKKAKLAGIVFSWMTAQKSTEQFLIQWQRLFADEAAAKQALASYNWPMMESRFRFMTTALNSPNVMERIRSLNQQGWKTGFDYMSFQHWWWFATYAPGLHPVPSDNIQAIFAQLFPSERVRLQVEW